MKNSQHSPFLKDERRKTDDSLVAERTKTNESLIKSKKSAELQTDKVVQVERQKSDSTTTKSRQTADEQKLGNSRLFDERKRADEAVDLERSKIDLAICQEREVKLDLANRALDQERMLTDKNLSEERTRTDSEVQRTSSLLHSEISEHAKTKVALTSREEFLAIVSHDLKNPIGTASLSAKMLMNDPTFKNLEPKVARSIEMIKRNIDTSLRLIADLLDMERIEEGKIKLKLEKHSLAQIISESIESFSIIANENQISLKATPAVESMEIECDRDRVLQVLSNLIGNALKFTPIGGSITLNGLFNETEVHISVCDTGPGVPENMQEQIFKRFAQLGQNNRTGLGLGLYISKMLIEEHHGKLWVDSKLNEGSTFYFSIPQRYT